MTEQCQEWIEYCVGRYPCKGGVLEVGSFDVNGNPRHHFKDPQRFPSYVGIDMREGPCVDKVMNVQQMEFPDNHFGVIVDAERLEHDNRFWVSIKELYRVLKPGGYIIVTTRSWGGMHPHAYPHDYWRFMDSGLKDLLEYAGFECLATAYGERWAAGDKAVFAVGRKPEALSEPATTSPRPFHVVIPSRNADNLKTCIQAIADMEPIDLSRVIVVKDGPLLKKGAKLPSGPTYISGVEPFIFARNVNLGIKAADSDVIVLNDDAILRTPRGFSAMASHAEEGIISAVVDGFVGNKNQEVQSKPIGMRRESVKLCFVCVLIPKKVQEIVGLLDPRFNGYGFEDNDYSKRAVDAGIPLSIYDGCVVEHESLAPTFRSDPGWVDALEKAQKIFVEKWA